MRGFSIILTTFDCDLFEVKRMMLGQKSINGEIEENYDIYVIFNLN